VKPSDATDDLLHQCLPDVVLVPGPTRRRSLTWLDTADWRLHRKGLSGQLERVGTSVVLVVQGPRDERVECALPVGVRAPLRLEQVPDGPVRRALAPVLGVRALLPLAEGESSVREVRVLDEEAKTVVRLVVQEPAVVQGVREGVVPLRVRLVPVRGYDAAARKVSAALREHDLVLIDGAARGAVAVLEAAGYLPGALPGVVDPPPEPGTPAAVAVARLLRSYLDQIDAHLPGTVADLDIEFLHDLRIAVRRSRSTLKLAGDVLPAGAVEQYAAELKWLGDVTTPVRDLDVHLLGLPELARRLVAFAPGDLDPFCAHLARHRVSAQAALARGLASTRCGRFRTQWRALLDRVAAGDAGDSPGVSVGALAAARVARADRRVVRLGSRITAESPAEDLHTLRKRAKELRYVLDLFDFVLDRAHVAPLVRELKALQDVLGVFQDSQVQREALATIVTQMVAEQDRDRQVPVDTLLAVGELATHLEEDRRRAREAFDARFARFVRPVIRAHAQALAAIPKGNP
jgi:CHAD domain-containing protein